MMRLREFLRDAAGSVVIETAIVLPVLGTLALGGYEVSMIVSRHNELQVAAAEASAIVLARPPEDQAERDSIKDVVEASTGLADSNVTFAYKYRCDTDSALVDSSGSCGANDVISEFIIITMRDSYTPSWTEFGVGNTINYNVERRVQVS